MLNMRKVKRSIFAAVGVTLVALAAAAGGLSGTNTKNDAAATSISSSCKPLDHFKTIHSGQLTVVYTPELPWWGVNRPLIMEFAKRECLKYSERNVPASAGLTLVQQGRADVSDGG